MLFVQLVGDDNCNPYSTVPFKKVTKPVAKFWRTFTAFPPADEKTDAINAASAKYNSGFGPSG